MKADGRERAGGADGGELEVPAGTVQGAVLGYGTCVSHGTQLGRAGGRTPRVLFSLEPLRWLQLQLQVATAEY